MLELNEVKYTLRKNWPLKDFIKQKSNSSSKESKNGFENQNIDFLANWS